MADSIFTKILKREVPAEILFEDEHSFAIPDRFPSMEGQVLVIPKQQVAYLFDLPDGEYRALMDSTRTLAQALDSAYSTVRTCVVIEGFEVPHIHIRLYPATTEKLVLSPRHKASDEALKEVAEKVRAALHSL